MSDVQYDLPSKLGVWLEEQHTKSGAPDVTQFLPPAHPESGGEGHITGTTSEKRLIFWTVYPGANTVTVRPVYIQGATVETSIPEDVMRMAMQSCDAAKGETFEYGVESQFTLDLEALVLNYGSAAIAALRRLIMRGQMDDSVTAEAMRSIGYVDHFASASDRLSLLQWGLFSSSPGIRKGAIVGLAYIDDPKAIPSIRKAIEREQIGWLRTYMQQVLIQLEETLRCQPASSGN